MNAQLGWSRLNYNRHMFFDPKPLNFNDFNECPVRGTKFREIVGHRPLLI